MMLLSRLARKPSCGTQPPNKRHGTHEHAPPRVVIYKAEVSRLSHEPVGHDGAEA